jgi:ketosteroid isomerase-like protein
MEIWQLTARESIRDLVARYNATGDSGRFDETLALFAQDAVLEIVPDQCYRGHDEIRNMFTRAASPIGARDGDDASNGSNGKGHHLRHFTATHQIDISGPDDAAGRCYFAVLTERGLDHWGRYLDRYRRDDGRWLFATREVRIDGRVPGSWAEQASARLRGSAAPEADRP